MNEDRPQIVRYLEFIGSLSRPDPVPDDTAPAPKYKTERLTLVKPEDET